MERFGIQVLSLFGSAATGAPHPSDLDVGVIAGDSLDLVELVSELAELLGTDRVDVVDLNRASVVLKAEALAGIPLYEVEPDQFVTEQIRAFGERMDTAWLRRLDLETMAG